MPAGVSRLSDNGLTSSEALALGSVLMLIFGALSAWGFVLVGEACAATGERSYVGAWRKTLGPAASFLPALASLLLCGSGAIACAEVLADTATDLLAGVLSLQFDALSRNGVLAALTATVLAPLCCLRSLAPLGTASAIGVAGVLMAAGTLVLRFYDGSYAVGGPFHDVAMWTPAFDSAAALASASASAASSAATSGALPSAGSLAFFVCLASNAFLAHYNAPSVYSELAATASTATSSSSRSSSSSRGRAVTEALEAEAAAEGSLGRLTSPTAAEFVNNFFRSFIGATTLPWRRGKEQYLQQQQQQQQQQEETAGEDEEAALASFVRTARAAYLISAALFVTIAAAGFGTFGDASQALILNNYASSDPLAAVARAGIGLCVLFEFPLLERPFRLTALELVGRPEAAAAPAVAVASCASLCAVAALGVDLDTICSLGGATGGALLIYVAPALMGLRLEAAAAAATGEEEARGPQARLLACAPLWMLASLGTVLAGVGTLESLSTA